MTDLDRIRLINDIVAVCHRLYQKGFVASHDGNVTAKLQLRSHPEPLDLARDEGSQTVILATPTSVSKGDVIPEIILTLDMEGKKLAGPGKPFSEIQLHLAAYRARGDVNAVVHAHPPFATARGVVGRPLDRPFLPEAVVSLGEVIPLAEFSMPGDPKNETIVAEMLQISNAFMMPGNGVLSVGTDVEQAYLRLELVEHIAKIAFIAESMGKPMSLAQGDVATLLEKRAKAGLAPPRYPPLPNGERVGPPATLREAMRAGVRGRAPSDDSELRKIIAEEIAHVLEK